MSKWKNKTRGGHKVRVICEDHRSRDPIIALVENPPAPSVELLCTYDKDGAVKSICGPYQKMEDFDLLPEEIHTWVAVYQSIDGAISIHPHESREAAYAQPLISVGGNKISCFEMVIEPGNGLTHPGKPWIGGDPSYSELRPCPHCGVQPTAPLFRLTHKCSVPPDDNCVTTDWKASAEVYTEGRDEWNEYVDKHPS